MTGPAPAAAPTAPASPPDRRDRLGYVDSIRGLAALAVIYFHMSRYFIQTGFPMSGIERGAMTLTAYVFDTGKIGVGLFFAVSGFVVPFSLLRGKRHAVRDFCVSRFFRLYPAYWLSIPFGVYFFFVVRGEPFGIAQILVNFTMLQQFVGQPNAIGAYWTLQIELVFYVLCVAIFLLGRLRDPGFLLITGAATVLVALAAGAVRHVTGIGLPIALLLALTLMQFGLLWRFALLEGDRVARRNAWILAGLFVAAMPAIAALSYHGDGDWYRYTITYYAALLLFILFTTRWRIHGRAFRYLGAVSYSVYLLAPVVQEAVVLLVPPPAYPGVSPHIYVLATMALSVAAASCSYHLIEKPAIALGKRLSAYLDHGASRRSPTTEVV